MTDRQRQAVFLAIAAVIGFAGGRFTASPASPVWPDDRPSPVPGPWFPIDPIGPGPSPGPLPGPGPFPTPGPDPFRPDPKPDPYRPGP